MNTTVFLQAVQALRQAEREVEPFVGPVIGMDSAAAVYEEALGRQGYDISDLVPAAMKPTWDSVGRTKARGGARSMASLAQDAKAAKGLAERFPDSTRLKSAL